MNYYMNPVATLTNRKMTLDIKSLPARLGRNSNVVDIYLLHESVSREHCLFECINHRFTVRDLGSTVGTFINGVRLEPNIPYNIEDGAKIQFGKVKMVFHGDNQALAEWERMQSQPAPAAQAPQTQSQSYGGSDPFAGQSFGGEAPGEQDFGGYAPAALDNKGIKVSARELNEYEYNEGEVVYIDCGLGPVKEPIEEHAEKLEAAIASEEGQADWKSTQVLSAEESADLAAAVKAASEGQFVAVPEVPDVQADAPMEEPALSSDFDSVYDKLESAGKFAFDWGPSETPAERPAEAPAEEPVPAEEPIEAPIEAPVVEAAPEELFEKPAEEPAPAGDLAGSIFIDEGTVKIEEPDEEEQKKTLHLTWIDDTTGETKKLNIDHFPFAIGRKSDVNDYTIPKKGVSRKHLRFEESDGEIYVYDDASTNGVRLNGKRIVPETQVKLSSGDTIRVLDITFAVAID